MSQTHSFDSIASLQAFVGTTVDSTEPIQVSQSVIDTFAEITHDAQWIHVDPVRAVAESPFGTTIAHGLLTLSLLTGWYHRLFAFPGRKLALNYGFDKVRFTAPVPSGSLLSASFRLDQVETLSESEARCHWHVEVRAQDTTRPALVARWLMQLRY
ncbi:MaoC family dehydratase [uncultured Pseudacidovorax sp.]|uniref:MaoC family dehydratase n=1 Tax=uncultured Pseudacidovorax sp. TaxID=679313 RepID=UPI0025EDF7F6|nr:MaoC family dehydratase [uncultured Pseudacidovorax sp.]